MSSIVARLQDVVARANYRPQIVYPEGWSADVCAAALIAKKEHHIDPIVIFRKQAEVPADFDPEVKTIIVQNADLQRYAEALYELRKNKGMLLAHAQTEVLNPNVLASLLIKLGEADGEVCGREYPTADTLRPALQLVRTAPDSKIVSSLFVLERDGEQLVFADCALNVTPSPAELTEITYGAVSFAQKLMGIERPRVALLSYSTYGSGLGESVDRVRAAINLIEKDPRFSNADVRGEMQFDAAYVDRVRKQKAPKVDWDSKPHIYIFPSIDAGNIGYKIAQRLGGYTATGPILIGLNKPVNDLSRGASVQEIVNVSVITAAQVIASKNSH